MEYVDWVRLSGRRVELAGIRSDPDNYTRLLATARAERNAECLCRTPSLRLVTRCSRSGRHHLACWPNTGPDHDPRCAFYQIDPAMTGRSTYSVSAIRETETGTAIRFAAPLVSTPSETTESTLAHSVDPGIGRRSVGLLGLLHYLWETARLNTWTSGTRDRKWTGVHRQLAEVISTCTVSGQPAHDVLYTVPPYRPDRAEANLAAFDRFLASLHGNTGHVLRGLVVGEIKAVHRTGYGMRYQLAHQSRQRQIFLRHQLDVKLRRSFRNAFATAGAAAGGRRVAIFYIEASRAGYATAIDAAMMLTNGDYIPADSSHEVRMADALKAAGRTYVKPLRFDANAEAVLPDFVLTDTPNSYVEVWGLPGREDYERRKAEKLTHYQQTAAHLIEWTVTDPMPNLTPHAV